MTQQIKYQSKNTNLFQSHSGEDLLHLLLTQRGIEDVPTFLNLPHSVLHDSFLFKHIEAGVELLAKHLHQKSRICFLVDSDLDGHTSSAILWLYIKRLTGMESQFIVHSGKQHGLTPEIMERVLASDCQLLICPDSTTNDVKQCQQLQEAGIEVLVLDHHEIECENPYAVVINNQDGQYPNKTLVGAAVVYKFIQTFNRTYQIEVDMREYLALTALALISDMAWLGNPESRLLTLEGLKYVDHNPFFKALCEKQSYSMKDKVTIEGVAWYVAPLLNAVIRLGSVEDKRDLFKALIGHEEAVPYTPKRSAKNPNPTEIIQTFQEAMVRRCTSFKTKQTSETKKGMEKLSQQIEEQGLDQHKILIVNGEDLNPTFTGLVANKLAERYKRPCLVVRHKNKQQPFVGGSGRNYEKCSLVDFKSFLNRSGLMEMAQGHAESFGLQLHIDNVPLLLRYADEQLAEMEVEDVYQVDAEIPIGQLMERDVLSVGKWDELWGGGLDRPKFLISNIYVMSDDIQLVGEKKNIIRFTVERGNQTFTFIKFFANETFYHQLIHRSSQGFSSSSGKRLKLTVIGEFKVNEYNGTEYPQIEIVAIQSEEVKQVSYF